MKGKLPESVSFWRKGIQGAGHRRMHRNRPRSAQEARLGAGRMVGGGQGRCAVAGRLGELWRMGVPGSVPTLPPRPRELSSPSFALLLLLLFIYIYFYYLLLLLLGETKEGRELRRESNWGGKYPNSIGGSNFFFFKNSDPFLEEKRIWGQFFPRTFLVQLPLLTNQALIPERTVTVSWRSEKSAIEIFYWTESAHLC